MAGAVLVALAVGAALILRPTLDAEPGSSPGPDVTVTDTLQPSPNVTSVAVPPGLPASEPLTADQIVVPRAEEGMETQLYTASVSGADDLRPLVPGRTGNYFAVGLSPARQTIIYIDSEAAVMRTMAVDGTGDQAILGVPPSGCSQILHASWSPKDLFKIAITCRNKSEIDVLMVITIDGLVERVLQTGAPRVDDPAISPDGKNVAYWASSDPDAPGGALFVVPMDGSGPPRRLTSGAADADPAWSPDGRSIAFSRRIGSDTAAQSDVFVVGANSSTASPGLTGPAIDEKPAWSPDSKRLLVVSNRKSDGAAGSREDVWLVQAAGGQARPLGIAAEHIATPTWSLH